MTIQHTDPLETVLQQAFASELIHNTEHTLMQQISQRIAREQMIRTLVLGLVGTAALAAGVLILLPALSALAASLTLPTSPAMPAWLAPGTATGIAAAILLAPWLYSLADDPL